jgi:hypothetical protein
LNYFTVTAINPEEPSGEEIVRLMGDTLFTRPFGLFILDVKNGRDYTFCTHVWKKVEMGNYSSAPQSIQRKMKVKVDGVVYFVSSAEFDAQGCLSLSIFTETESLNDKQEKSTVRENQWILIFAPGTYDFVERIKLKV